MFVQVIKGHTNDPEGMRRRGDAWRAEVAPGAIGYVGSTSGTADDGTTIVVARFTDEAAARRNSERPEQQTWWEETAKYFDDEPTFRESSDTTTLFEGGSDAARFVQVMEGRAKDRERAEALETPEMLEQLRSIRPDLLGGLRIWFDRNEFVDVAYFTSEDAARAGETSAEFDDAGGEFAEAFGEMTYLDLRDPDLHTA